MTKNLREQELLANRLKQLEKAALLWIGTVLSFETRLRPPTATLTGLSAIRTEVEETTPIGILERRFSGCAT